MARPAIGSPIGRTGGASDGRFLAAWGALGAGEGQFRLARGIALDQQGNIYVTDAGRVQTFRLRAPPLAPELT